jgi:hypothetical protein
MFRSWLKMNAPERVIPDSGKPVKFSLVDH